MPTRLELQFQTSEGKNRTLAIQSPILDLNPEEVQAAMETIIDQELFDNEGENLYDSVKGARYVTRIVEDLLEIE